MKHFLSFGGGVNSVALYLLMQDLKMEFEAVFVDHGGDWPETYEYLRYFIATGRPVTIIKPSYNWKKQGKLYSNIYDFAWDRRKTPSRVSRWCTGKFKAQVVDKYIDRPCFQHLGIDAGEKKRAKLSSVKGVESRFLLIEHEINRQGCVALIEKHKMVVPPKSGCWFCPFQRLSQWRMLRKKHPDLFCKAQELEKRNMDYRAKQGMPEFTLLGNGRVLADIINGDQIALPGMEEEVEYPPCQCGL